MIRGERERNEDDTDICFMYDQEVFIQRLAVKGHLYGTLLCTEHG